MLIFSILFLLKYIANLTSEDKNCLYEYLCPWTVAEVKILIYNEAAMDKKSLFLVTTAILNGGQGCQT
jgi:hypothetical protein